MSVRGQGSRQVALIRGINVGRAKRVAMADLRAMLERLGYTDCRTVLNSGNALFTAERDSPSRSSTRIEEAMAGELGVSAPVVALGAADFATVVRENPLTEIADNPSRLLVAFVMDPANRAKLALLAGERWDPEAFALGSHAAYLWIPGGVLESRLHRAVEQALGKKVTARNWKTVKRIEALL